MLSFDDNDRMRLTLTVTVDLDPAQATVALAVDDVEYPCAWTGAATQADGKWTRTAITASYFAGPAVPTAAVAGAAVLAYDVHKVEVRVTNGPVIKASPLPQFVIRR